MKWPRRTRFVVDTRLQFSVVFITLGYVGFLLLVVAISLFGPLIFQLRNVGAGAAISTDEANAALSILYLHNRFWLPVILALGVIVLHSLRTTHRIAGPLYRFRCIFEAVRDGVLPKPARLRRGDYLGAEMDAINGAVASLRGRLGQAQQEARQLHDHIVALHERAAAANGGAIDDSVWNELDRAAARLGETLGWFRIEQ